jgi:hypothetical protein
VLGEGGRPVAGAECQAVCRDGLLRWVESATTDAAGTVCIPVGGCSRLLFGVRKGATHYGIEVELGADGSRTEVIRLEPTASVRIRLVDGEDPLAGVACWLQEEASGWPLPLHPTNAAGIAVWDELRVSTYRAILSGQGLWHTEALVLPANESDAVVPIQVRRVGALEIQVRNAAGLPVAGLPLELESAEFHETASSWLAQGRIGGPAGGLVTDGQGEIALSGLPRGSYLWSADAGGGPAGGLVEVPPGGTAEAALVVP